MILWWGRLPCLAFDPFHTLNPANQKHTTQGRVSSLSWWKWSRWPRRSCLAVTATASIASRIRRRPIFIPHKQRDVPLLLPQPHPQPHALHTTQGPPPPAADAGARKAESRTAGPGRDRPLHAGLYKPPTSPTSRYVDIDACASPTLPIERLGTCVYVCLVA